MTREIDELIATTVMGWHQGTAGPLSNWHEPACKDDGRCLPQCGFQLPDYTSGPVASKALREKLAGCWAIHLVHYSKNQQYPGRKASCGLYSAGILEVCAEADTEELAVALCACNAFSIEVES